MSLELRFTLANQPLQVVPLLEGRTLIGTLMSNEIVIRAPGVDPIHAMIEITEDNRAIVTDLGSRSGVKLNGKNIEVEEPIKVGDTILIGNVSMEICAHVKGFVPPRC